MTYWVGSSVKMNETLAETIGFAERHTETG